MNDIIKDIFSASVQIISALHDAWKANLETLITKGKITRKDGDRILSELELKVKECQKQYEKTIKSLIKGFSSGIFGSKEEHGDEMISEQEKRIKSLELKVSLLVKEMNEIKDLNKAVTKAKRRQSSRQKSGNNASKKGTVRMTKD